MTAAEAVVPAARAPRRRRAARLLAVDRARGRIFDARSADLGRMLRAGDVLVVNDAATLPGSLQGRAADGEELEIRLAGPPRGSLWPAILFGAGSWHTPTERRPPPPAAALRIGAKIQLGPALSATVVAQSPLSPRLIEVAFDLAGEALWAALYARGAPIQYAHLDAPLPLAAVQTAYASRPWAAEMPSAGAPLSWELLLGLRRRGVAVARLTHAAGVSATGDPAIDAALPLPERFEIPDETVRAIAAARGRGGRVIAVGTTVVRALEGAAAQSGGILVPGAGETDLVLDASFRPRVASGIVTGIHPPTESHFRLLRAFASEEILVSAWRHAAEMEYLSHEFGDLAIIADRLELSAGAASWTSSSATASTAAHTDASTTRSATPDCGWWHRTFAA